MSRVFAATRDFVQACEQLDRGLVSSIDSNIEPVMMLEDIGAGSLKTYFRLALNAMDDQALKKGEWQAAVGGFLLAAKYYVLDWMDSGEWTSSTVDSLSRRIQQTAQDTDVKYLPDYAPPQKQVLLDAAQAFQTVKDNLVDGDGAYVEDNNGVRHTMNMAVKFDVEDVGDLISGEQELGRSNMRLIVKKPDYLGDSQWDFRHGKRALSAKIEDRDWLDRFQNREVSIRPGDALSCSVRIERVYDLDNELHSERFFIEKVNSIIEHPPSPRQGKLLP